MIQAKELMLGNWVKNPNNNEYSQITAMDISDIQSGIKVRQGITLTEELLLKCGFEDKTYQSGYIGKEFRSNMILDFVLTKPRKLYETQDYYVFELREHRIVPIKYLHQLQNIYFSITQQELEVNL